MRQRWWLIVVIALVCVGLGVLIAGIPDKARDRPLSVRVVAATASSTTSTSTTSTTSTTTTPPPQPRAPGAVHVRVANASTTPLGATHMTTRIGALGYQTLAPLNSNRTDLATTVIVFSPGFELEAHALAQALGATQVVAGDPTLTCNPEACAGDVIVFVGRDLAT